MDSRSRILPELKWFLAGACTVGLFVVPGAGLLWVFGGAAALALGSVALLRLRHYRPGHCPHCKYNLKGNESGMCPECGTEVPAAVNESHGSRPSA